MPVAAPCSGAASTTGEDATEPADAYVVRESAGSRSSQVDESVSHASGACPAPMLARTVSSDWADTAYRWHGVAAVAAAKASRATDSSAGVTTTVSGSPPQAAADGLLPAVGEPAVCVTR